MYNPEEQPGIYFVTQVALNGSGQYVPVTNSGGGSAAASQVFAQYADVSVGTGSTQLAPASSTPRRVTLDHPGGTNIVYCACGKTATLNSGHPLYPGGTWTSDPCLGAINGIVASGTENVTPWY